MTVTPPDLPHALAVDRDLCDIELSLDFLLAVTPTNVREAWRVFRAGGYRAEPHFRYRPLPAELGAVRARLGAVPLDTIEEPSVAELLRAKHRELGLKIGSLQQRGTRAFLEASVALYGGVGDDLLSLALAILDRTRRPGPPPPHRRRRPVAGARTFALRAKAELDRYRAAFPALASRVVVREDVPSVMAFEGDLLVPSDLEVPAARVDALIQHEVGTHLLTWANGGVHALHGLRVGLAGYEETQEALAVFAEYAAGGLTSSRIAQLAARVVAVHGLLEGATFPEVFSRLHRRHHVPPRSAFGVVARVFRSGGLTKDAVYLRGLVRLLDHIAAGGPVDPLFVGKLPLDRIALLPHLEHLGLLRTPPLRPTWVDDPDGQRRLAAARAGLAIPDLAEEEAA